MNAGENRPTGLHERYGHVDTEHAIVDCAGFDGRNGAAHADFGTCCGAGADWQAGFGCAAASGRARGARGGGGAEKSRMPDAERVGYGIDPAGAEFGRGGADGQQRAADIIGHRIVALADAGRRAGLRRPRRRGHRFRGDGRGGARGGTANPLPFTGRACDGGDGRTNRRQNGGGDHGRRADGDHGCSGTGRHGRRHQHAGEHGGRALCAEAGRLLSFSALAGRAFGSGGGRAGALAARCASRWNWCVMRMCCFTESDGRWIWLSGAA